MLKEYDRFSGITETIEKKDGKWNVHRSKDLTTHIDSVQKLRGLDDGSWKGDMHHVASIDPIIWEMWIKELKQEGRNPNPADPSNRSWFVAKLNNRDYSKLRTKDGNI